MQGLRDSAAPAFAPATSDGEGVTGSETPLEPQLPLAELVELLRQQSLSASDRFSLMSPQLRRVFSKDSYDRIGEHIDNLRFSDAADGLQASQRRTPLMSVHCPCAASGRGGARYRNGWLPPPSMRGTDNSPGMRTNTDGLARPSHVCWATNVRQLSAIAFRSGS